jgi:hypothetical protein
LRCRYYIAAAFFFVHSLFKIIFEPLKADVISEPKIRPVKRTSCAILCLFFVIISYFSVAQNIKNNVIQLSGVVLTSDTLTPVPFANVIVRSTGRGVMTDYYGFFSIVVQEKDEIVFSAMGYKSSSYTIPDTLTMSRYSLIHVLTPDTIYLTEAVIYPWSTYEAFKKAFVKMTIPDDNYEKALRNFAMIVEMKDKWEDYPMDANMNYNNFVNQKVSKLYYAGQLPPNNLLNPFAWASFIRALKKGKLKIEK